MAARMASWHEGGYSFGLAFRSSKAEVWCFAKGKNLQGCLRFEIELLENPQIFLLRVSRGIIH